MLVAHQRLRARAPCRADELKPPAARSRCRNVSSAREVGMWEVMNGKPAFNAPIHRGLQLGGDVLRRIKQLGPMGISLIALFVVLGGNAAATTGFIITSTDQIQPSVLSQLRGRRGPQGPPGRQGPRGLRGPAGPSSRSEQVQALRSVESGTGRAGWPPRTAGNSWTGRQRGSAGAKGPKGPAGAKGPAGPQDRPR